MKRLLPLLIVAIILQSCGHSLSIDLSDEWTLSGDTAGICIGTSVPSVVQTDLYEAGLIPHPYIGIVENDLQWIPEHTWTYTRQFNVSNEIMEQDVVEIVFEGVAGYADAWLNGIKLYSFDNMFIEHRGNVKDLLKRKNNILVVKTKPYRKTQDSAYDELNVKLPERYSVSRHAAYQHGWDWAPRYTNIGIWKPVRIEGWSEPRIVRAAIITDSIVHGVAHLHLDMDLKSCKSQNVLIKLSREEEPICTSQAQLSGYTQRAAIGFSMANPDLWFPNGSGRQPLYNFDIQVTDSTGRQFDAKTVRTGIRTIRLIDEPDSYGRRFYFEVNGQPVYAKGGNYIPEDMFTPWMNRQRTESLLKECAEANFNMIRVWGGGIYPYNYFFDLCDSLGIMVWQDFMFAGTMYPYDSRFINSVTTEAVQQTKRLAGHPSLALWCGNNEVSEGYYNWGWQKSLNWTEEQDREIKAGYDTVFENIFPHVVSTFGGCDYWPSSPSKGWGRAESLTEGDIHYWGVWWGDSLYDTYRNKVGRFCSEYGYQSMPSTKTLETMNGGQKPALGSPVLKAHQKHSRGYELIELQLDEYFPPYSNTDEYVYLSQVSQAYGLGIAIEAQRERMPYCMGSLYWQINDAWPVVSWSSIDYYGNKKALQYRLKHLFAPVSITDNNIVNDLHRNLKAKFSVDAYSTYDSRPLNHTEKEIHIRANSVLPIDIHLDLSEEQKKHVFLVYRLEYDNQNIVKHRYYAKPKDLLLTRQQINCSTKQDGESIVLTLSCKTLMKDIMVSANVDGEFSDNFFDLCPGMTKRIAFTPTGDAKANDVSFDFMTLNELTEKGE